MHDRECGTCAKLFTCKGKPEGTKRCLSYLSRHNYGVLTTTVDDFIDKRSMTNRPNTPKEEIGKYYDLTNKHMVVNEKKQKAWLMDDWN